MPSRLSSCPEPCPRPFFPPKIPSLPPLYCSPSLPGNSGFLLLCYTKTLSSLNKCLRSGLFSIWGQRRNWNAWIGGCSAAFLNHSSLLKHFPQQMSQVPLRRTLHHPRMKKFGRHIFIYIFFLPALLPVMTWGKYDPYFFSPGEEPEMIQVKNVNHSRSHR